MNMNYYLPTAGIQNMPTASGQPAFDIEGSWTNDFKDVFGTDVCVGILRSEFESYLASKAACVRVTAQKSLQEKMTRGKKNLAKQFVKDFERGVSYRQLSSKYRLTREEVEILVETFFPSEVTREIALMVRRSLTQQDQLLKEHSKSWMKFSLLNSLQTGISKIIGLSGIFRGPRLRHQSLASRA
jgi:hypothetical protein